MIKTFLVLASCLPVSLALGQCPLFITEIQADPTPSRGLPEVEYLEIYVDSPQPISSQGWTLRVNNTVATFPAQILQPDSRYVLVAESQRARVDWAAPTLGLSRLTLPNTGAVITLQSPTGPCQSVTFDPTWGRRYEEGGYSLELMNRSGACLGKSLWQSTQSLQGGTPGLPPVGGEWPLPNPRLVSIVPDSTGWALHFSQTMLPEVGRWNGQTAVGSWLSETIFRIPATPVPDVWQRGTLTEWVDCTQQILPDTVVAWGWFSPPQPGEWRWNEVLVAPVEGSQGFFEIKSEAKVPRLWPGGQITYGSASSTRPVTHSLPSQGQILSPGETWAFTGLNPRWESIYTVKGRVDSLRSWVDLANEGGTLRLSLSNGQLLDEVVYSSDWHHVLLAADQGRSWQRFSQHWSPSPTVWGLASPGWQPEDSGKEASWQLEPAYLSHQQTEALLHFSLPSADYVLSATIVTPEGQVVYRYPTSHTWPPSGTITWSFPALPGIGKYYYLHFHGFHPDGHIFQQWVPFIWEFD